MRKITADFVGLNCTCCFVSRYISIAGHISRVFQLSASKCAVMLAFITSMVLNFEAKADQHYFSLKKIFPSGKCSPVIPNYELLIAGFSGGDITKFKIYDSKGEVTEVITILVNKNRDQWAIVGSKTDRKVIFCLYSSGVGKNSVEKNNIK